MNNDCDDHQPWLASSVEAKVTGRSLANWEQVRSYLLGCPTCALDYAWLLCFSSLEEQGLLPAVSHYPPLDISFLSRNDQDS